jgi:hypothetical protein
VEAWDALLPPSAGWRAGEEGKLRITPQGQPTTGDPGETIIPREGEERLILVAVRCLYGVDKNPLAVDIAKLSMWLITMDRAKPSTFPDHAFKCGDSIIAVHLDQLICWKPENAYSQLKAYAQISKK